MKLLLNLKTLEHFLNEERDVVGRAGKQLENYYCIFNTNIRFFIQSKKVSF